MDMKRRSFLELTAAASAGMAVAGKSFAFGSLAPTVEVENPLAGYPDRGWEKTYLDQYRYDQAATWVCSPNCTHECRMLGFIRNGVLVRSEQNYDCHKVKDLYGNEATAAWNPRGCSNGFTYQRRVYGPYRLRGPIMRKGWKAWADAGFPELTPELKKKYLFDDRGNDEWLKVTWDQAVDYMARGYIAIATRYSGEEGKKRLLAQGYPEEMLVNHEGAGTRTCKLRGGMGLLGVMGKYGMYRFSNMLALLDTHVRGVGPDQAKGGRNWSNYTWHGDQAPGHPFVHGLQASDCDFNDLRHTKLHVQIGKNLVENKRPDSHFFIETMERGAKIVVVAPEYSPPATKADYWIAVRPNADTALLLGITKILMDNAWYDADFVKKFSDFPLLVRTDNLKRLEAKDLFPGHVEADLGKTATHDALHMHDEERAWLPDHVVFDGKSGKHVPISHPEVGEVLAKRGIDPALEGKWTLKLVDGKSVECATLFTLYKDIHLKDYDIDSVVEMTRAPKDLILRLAKDMATIKPMAIHIGEGLNHWFHATEMNRACYLPSILTGNIGKPGAGCHTWAGNYKAAIFQGMDGVGPGFKGWVAEDPFNPNLDPAADGGKDVKVKGYGKDEEPAYWNHGDVPLLVETPKYGKKCFTGKSHLPTPTKALWFTNVNLINNAKWAYEMIKNVDPKIEMIVSSDIEMTATVEVSDIALAANAWCEFRQPEITASCSNPFLQIWKGNMKPTYDTQDDVMIMALVAKRLGEILKDERFASYWKFTLEGKTEVYIQRLLDASTTTRGYRYDDIMAGKYGEPGTALVLFRTYPRNPFYENLKDSIPFYTPTGRMQAYNDEPEVIEYGENFIVHREGPEATPYLPNVIVSSNPLIRPEDYGIPETAMGADERHVRNVKKPWAEVKKTKNPLWEKGYQFYCLTPKSRHSTHSSWAVTDWQFIWSNDFGDPYRADKRTAGVGEHQLHINPAAARDLDLKEGDYVYVDANADDRPYRGWKPTDPFYKVSRLMLRVKYNSSYPYDIVMMKHAPFIATPKSVRAHETRADGRALSEGTGYQSSFRYGSQQSITRSWLMPMHQTDSLVHKQKVKMGFMKGGEADNHAVNTTPKETLVRITKAEAGGPGGKGAWKPGTTGYSPGNESDDMKAYLDGELTKG